MTQETVRTSTREIIFEVSEDEAEGGYVASAVGHGIHTQAETLAAIRQNVRDAVACHFDDHVPTLVRLHVVHDEILRSVASHNGVTVAELRSKIGI